MKVQVRRTKGPSLVKLRFLPGLVGATGATGTPGSLGVYTQDGTGAVADPFISFAKRHCFAEQFFDGTNDLGAACTRAYAAGFFTVLLASKYYYVLSKITVTSGRRLVALGQAVLQKSYNGDMVQVDDGGQVENVTLVGQGGTYTGRGFIVTSGNYQAFKNCGASDMLGHCLEFTTAGAGTSSVVEGNNIWSCHDSAAVSAIKLPDDEPGTVGIRKFIALNGGGGWLIDAAGSNVTEILGCAGLPAVTMNDNVSYLTMTMSRNAGPLNVHGNGVRLVANTINGLVTLKANSGRTTMIANELGTGVTLETGASATIINPELAGTIVDNSGLAANVIDDYAVNGNFSWKTDSGTQPVLGNGALGTSITRRGKNFIVRIKMTVGSTTTVAGALGFFYFQAGSGWNFNAIRDSIGSASINKFSGTDLTGAARITAGDNKIYIDSVGGAQWSEGNPALASGDIINIQIEYPVA